MISSSRSEVILNFVLGDCNFALGDPNFVLGDFNFALGDSNFVLGDFNFALADSNFVLRVPISSSRSEVISSQVLTGSVLQVSSSPFRPPVPKWFLPRS